MSRCAAVARAAVAADALEAVRLVHLAAVERCGLDRDHPIAERRIVKIPGQAAVARRTHAVDLVAALRHPATASVGRRTDPVAHCGSVPRSIDGTAFANRPAHAAGNSRDSAASTAVR